MVTEPTFEWDDAKGQSNQVKHGVEKARRSMSNRTVKYTAGEIGRVRIVDDFLPAPEALVAREDNVNLRCPCPGAASISSSERRSRRTCRISA
jgi:hypothetical protein